LHHHVQSLLLILLFYCFFLSPRLRCNQVFQNCSGLSIDWVGRPSSAGQQDDDDNGSNATSLALLDNDQVCAVQKEGVDFQATVQYHTVFEVSFAESIAVRTLFHCGKIWGIITMLTTIFYGIDCLEPRRPFVGRCRRGLFHCVAVHQEHYSTVGLVLAPDGPRADANIAVAAPSRQICSRRCLCKHKNNNNCDAAVL
jgi:hypothetical protein